MKAVLSTLLVILSAVWLAAPTSAAIVVTGDIRLTTLTTMTLDASFIFGGATAQQFRSAADQQGNKNGMVDANESASFEASLRETMEKSFTEDDGDDDSPPTLDDREFKDPEGIRTFSLTGLSGTSTTSQEPITMAMGMDSSLDGAAPGGNEHTFTMESDSDDEEEEDESEEIEGAVKIHVPDGHEICSVRGAKKLSSTTAEFSTKTASSLFGGDIEIEFVTAGTACPKDDGGFLPAAPWASLVALGVALAAVRSRRRSG